MFKSHGSNGLILCFFSLGGGGGGGGGASSNILIWEFSRHMDIIGQTDTV